MPDDLEPSDQPITNTGKTARWPDTRDAMAWGTEFCARFNVTDDAGDPLEDCRGVMISWFANAIERGVSQATGHPTDPAYEERMARKHSLLAAREALAGTASEATDLVAVATWVYDGTDPWPPTNTFSPDAWHSDPSTDPPDPMEHGARP